METLNTIEKKFNDFIVNKNHPCLMANTVFQMKKYKLKKYDNMLKDNVILPILADIEKYINEYDFNSNDFESLIITFKDNIFETEIEFEKALWQLLQKLHDNDDVEWDKEVSKNPEDTNFSFSVKGKAFYIVGMHPKSSRMARRVPYCTLVFNLHCQFEKLRKMGAYERVKNRIRKRDEALQGSINPVLKDFGQESESKQYSGRNVGSNWKCPFHQNN